MFSQSQYQYFYFHNSLFTYYTEINKYHLHQLFSTTSLLVQSSTSGQYQKHLTNRLVACCLTDVQYR